MVNYYLKVEKTLVTTPWLFGVDGFTPITTQHCIYTEFVHLLWHCIVNSLYFMDMYYILYWINTIQPPTSSRPEISSFRRTRSWGHNSRRRKVSPGETQKPRRNCCCDERFPVKFGWIKSIYTKKNAQRIFDWFGFNMGWFLTDW